MTSSETASSLGTSSAADASTASTDSTASESSTSAGVGSDDSWDTYEPAFFQCGGAARPSLAGHVGRGGQPPKTQNVTLPMPRSTTVTNAMTTATNTSTTDV